MKRILIVLALAPFVLAGSCPPEIVDFRTFPQAVCAGAPVTLRLVVDEHTGSGRTTAAPTPVAGPATVVFAGSENLTVYDREYLICEPTTFDVTAWNGTETACGTDETVCDRTFASLIVDPHVENRSRTPCDGLPGTAEFEIDGVSTLVVDTVTNCGGRSVEVQCPDGGTTTILPGETSAAVSCVAGAPLARSWSARSTLSGLEGCPPPPELVPRPLPPPPPPICLTFEASCPDSDACG